MGGFHDLIAYRCAAALADDLRAEVVTWPSIDEWTLGVQLVRAADSVGANIAEGVGRHGFRDQARFLLMARGSAYEVQHWLERAFARGLIEDDSYRLRAARVGMLVNGLHRAQRRRAGQAK